MPQFLWLGGIHLSLGILGIPRGWYLPLCVPVFWQYRVVTVFQYSDNINTESSVLNEYREYSVLPKNRPSLTPRTMHLAHSWRFVSQTDAQHLKKKQCSLGDLPGVWENCISKEKLLSQKDGSTKKNPLIISFDIPLGETSSVSKYANRCATHLFCFYGDRLRLPFLRVGIDGGVVAVMCDQFLHAGVHLLLRLLLHLISVSDETTRSKVKKKETLALTHSNVRMA